MLIDALSGSIASLFGAPASTGAAPATDASGASVFGPAALLSLGTVDTGPMSGLYNAVGQALGAGVSAAQNNLSRGDRRALSDAQKLIEQRLYGEARMLLTPLVSRNKANPEVLAALGSVELAQREYGKAEALLSRAVALAPGQGYESQLDRARLLQKDDETVFRRVRVMLGSPDGRQEGADVLAALVRRSPQRNDWRLLLARTYVEQRQGETALYHYESAIQRADDVELSQIASDLGKLTKVAPKASYLRQLLGRTQLRQGRFDDARQTLELAEQLAQDGGVGIRTDRAKLEAAVGRKRLSEGEISVALEHLLDAKGLDASVPEVSIGLAEAYLARGRERAAVGAGADAVSDYRTAVRELGPRGDAELRERIARSAYTLGLNLSRRREAAGDDIGIEATAFQAAYDTEPTNLQYRRRLASTRNAIGDQYFNDGEYTDAAASYKRAWELERGNTTYRDNAVAAYVTVGNEALGELRYDAAVAAYQEARRIDPTSTAARTKLAAGYAARGEHLVTEQGFAQAAADFREAYTLEPENETYRALYETYQAYLD